jgi:hypothetical protein
MLASRRRREFAFDIGFSDRISPGITFDFDCLTLLTSRHGREVRSAMAEIVDRSKTTR